MTQPLVPAHRAVAMALMILASTAHACPVCTGDPASPMAQGAASGVLFMVVITYALVLCFGGFVMFWAVRARRLRISQSGDYPMSHAPASDAGRVDSNG